MEKYLRRFTGIRSCCLQYENIREPFSGQHSCDLCFRHMAFYIALSLAKREEAEGWSSLDRIICHVEHDV